MAAATTPHTPSGVQAPPRSSWTAHVLVGLGATAALTAVFWLTNLDVRLQALAYSPTEPHWPQGGLPGWVLVYHIGTLPGLILSILAGVGFGLSFVRRELVHWRFPCLFLVLLLALGPGLLINVLAKGFGGRPRPNQILEFGGLLAFHRPFEPGLSHKGFSFTCGHCSMGFMFMGLYFLLGGWKRWVCLGAGAIFGLFQGIGRMVQGAHFASDALLAGTLMFTLAAALSPLAAWRPGGIIEAKHAWRVAATTTLLIVLTVCGFLFSMPVQEDNVHVWIEPDQPKPPPGQSAAEWLPRSDAPPPAEIRVDVEVGDLTIEVAPQPEPLRIRSLVTGFAFPGSKSKIEAGHAGRTVSFRQRLSGLFVERHGTFLVSVREDFAATLHVSTRDGQIILAGSLAGRPLHLSGSFVLSDPTDALRAGADGTYTRSGRGAPLSLVLDAEKVGVQP